ncbi:class I SAM-dependent methyltransferase [Piscinibacter sakaiensis]|uniref:class I SAM-dependent methyltransferase n=1 Tax=Piscinibacter sakaiensis TaxID=1547922 RepID=UPI003AAF520D
MNNNQAGSVSAALTSLIGAAIADNGGWLPFDRFMSMALYQPGLGYYASGRRTFGLLPQSGSDFVTAPELSPHFGRALARQAAQALAATGSAEIVEFGAGSGALAAQLIDELDALGVALQRYSIVDLSASLRERQQALLGRFGDRVRWLDELPAAIDGLVVGNEVLDAMPVQLLHFDGERWFERGVASGEGGFAWADRPTDLRPPLAQQWIAGSTVEIHRQAEAFVTTAVERMRRCVAILVDYGFPQAEYYHPQRHQGTVMCHQAHLVDADPLVDVGAKDITAHVDFTAIALAAQDAGAEVIGYTSQARFLFNCGLAELLQAADPRERAHAQKLVNEHEMGELFKVIAFAKGCQRPFLDDPLGFRQGDRSHTL